MQVQPITSNPFGGKNTFLNKSKYAMDIGESKYFKSLHYEALSRLHYMRYQNASKELAEIKTLNKETAIKLIKTAYRALKEKVMSAINQTDSFHLFPKRFYAADNEMIFPHRFYNTEKL